MTKTKQKAIDEPCPICHRPFRCDNVHSWLLDIPDFVTPLANEFIRTRWGGGRRNRTPSRRQLKGTWELLLIEAGAQSIPAQKRKKRVVIVKRYCRGLEPDYGNLWLATDKLIIDNLVEMGILIDDTRRYVDWFPIPKNSPDKRTTVEIRERR